MSIATGALAVDKDAYGSDDLLMMPKQHAGCGFIRSITWESVN